MNIPILDHGYIKYIEHWGKGESGINEAAIIEAARMSTGKGFNGWDQDEKLLNYLYTHKHLTPFEMCGMTIEVAAPIFVFREWHRHRTQSYNEMSGRYIPLPNENYIPELDRLMQSGGVNKQAQGTGIPLTIGNARIFRERLENFYQIAEAHYQNALSDGIPKELARLVVPVARYSRMRASGNLRNWLAFLTLRMDPNAQWEIRQYANNLGEIIKEIFPRTYKLFLNPEGKVTKTNG